MQDYLYLHSITHNFTANGLKHANRLLGYEAFKPEDWEAIGEYDEAGARHRAFVMPKRELQVEGVALHEGERIRIEESYKYGQAQAGELWSRSGVMVDSIYANDASYGRGLCLPNKAIMLEQTFANRFYYHRQDCIY
jgi:L-histidine Nalpha-methyltransferase / hercynylcysteine S-oxide synthase